MSLFTHAYKLQPSLSERVIVDGHGCHTTLHFGVKAKENQDKVPTLYWLPKVSKGAKIRNRYNQVPHLTQGTNGKVTNSQQTPQTRAKRSALSQQVTTKHIQTEAHKDIANTRQNKNIKDPQKKYRLGKSIKTLIKQDLLLILVLVRQQNFLNC